MAAVLPLVLALLSSAVPARAATLPALGTAASFGVLAGSTITNTGSTKVSGDLGVSPGTAVTGFPPGTVTGTKHGGDAVALQAQKDATIAYNSAAQQACNFNLTGQDLGGKTLIPGVYCFNSSAQLTGQLIISGQGNPNGVFIIKTGTTLTTASNASILLTNSARPCNIFWQVGSSATLGTRTSFVGNILALTSITLNTGAVTQDGLYARNGAVTLDSNTISAGCAAALPTATRTTLALPTATMSTVPTSTPLPSTATTAPPTVTPLPPTSTTRATATRGPRPGATNTSVPSATNTSPPAETGTPLTGPVNTPTAGDTPTPVPGALITPTAGDTSTPVPGTLITPTPGNRLTPTPTARRPILPHAVTTPLAHTSTTPTALSRPSITPMRSSPPGVRMPPTGGSQSDTRGLILVLAGISLCFGSAWRIKARQRH